MTGAGPEAWREQMKSGQVTLFKLEKCAPHFRQIQPHTRTHGLIRTAPDRLEPPLQSQPRALCSEQPAQLYIAA